MFKLHYVNALMSQMMMNQFPLVTRIEILILNTAVDDAWV